MKRTHYLFAKAILVIVICLGLAFGHTNSVQTVDCTWEGDGNADWTLVGNWSCGHVPGTADTVNIPVVTTNYPVIYTNVDFPPSPVSSLTIEEGASLTINQGMALDATTMTINGTLLANAAASPISINVFTSGGVVNIGPAGAIKKRAQIIWLSIRLLIIMLER